MTMTFFIEPNPIILKSVGNKRSWIDNNLEQSWCSLEPSEIPERGPRPGTVGKTKGGVDGREEMGSPHCLGWRVGLPGEHIRLRGNWWDTPGHWGYLGVGLIGEGPYLLPWTLHSPFIHWKVTTMVRSKDRHMSVTGPRSREGPGPLRVGKLCWYSVPWTSLKVGSRPKGEEFMSKRCPMPSGKYTPSLISLWPQTPGTPSASEVLPASWSHIPGQNILSTC